MLDGARHAHLNVKLVAWSRVAGGARPRRDGRVPGALRVGLAREELRVRAPAVMLPFVHDEPLGVRVMAERGANVEVARDETDGSFDRDGVAAAVRRVMVDDEGKVLASNAKKLQEVLADQERQERYIDDVVEHLIRYKDE